MNDLRGHVIASSGVYWASHTWGVFSILLGVSASLRIYATRSITAWDAMSITLALLGVMLMIIMYRQRHEVIPTSITVHVDAAPVTIRNHAALHQQHIQRLHKYPPIKGGYVYIVQDASASGYYKIGRTDNPYRRLHGFEIKLPIQIHIVHIAPCQDSRRIERVLHTEFASMRVNGEWFNLDDIHLQYAIAMLELHTSTFNLYQGGE